MDSKECPFRPFLGKNESWIPTFPFLHLPLDECMHSNLRHIALFIFVVTIFVATAADAFADKSKKSPSARASKANNSLKMMDPVAGAMRATLTIVDEAAAKQRKTQNGNDTSRRDSRIRYVTVASDVLKITVDLANDDPGLEIGVYNMLGKKVLDVYKGMASKGPHEYTVYVGDLPEGVFVCIAQGADFRRAEKFYLNR